MKPRYDVPQFVPWERRPRWLRLKGASYMPPLEPREIPPPPAHYLTLESCLASQGLTEEWYEAHRSPYSKPAPLPRKAVASPPRRPPTLVARPTQRREIPAPKRVTSDLIFPENL